MERQYSQDNSVRTWRDGSSFGHAASLPVPGAGSGSSPSTNLIKVRHSPVRNNLQDESGPPLHTFKRTMSSSSDRFGPKPITKDFDALRTDFLKKGILYDDPDFPAEDTSLYFSRHPPYVFEWIRPPEISRMSGAKAFMMIDGTSNFDLKQGELGDCWVLAAAAGMSENITLVHQVVPPGQSFESDWYAGMFLFRFWRYGAWEEVIIDDRLPTVRGELVFVHSGVKHSYWGALLEKAYAKLHGSYEALKAGFVSDALHDFTGGLVESYHTRGEPSPPDNVINVLFKALEKQSLIGCGIQPIEGHPEATLPNGLVTGHAYTVTDLREIRLISDSGEVPVTLIRVRNPWGSRIEWNGPWCDRSVEWHSIPARDRHSMGLVFRDDGEFWMEFREFLTNFHTLDICNLTPDCLVESPRKWFVHTFHSRWCRGVSAGGRPVCRGTHWSNPQYKIVLRDCDDDEDNMCSIVVELQQKDRRKLKHKGLKNVDMGFVIYKCHKGFTLPLPKRYFDEYSFVERCDFYTNARQITKRFLLPPGDYVIIPSTYEPDVEADFMIRVFFEKDNGIEHMDGVGEVIDPSPSPTDPHLRDREQQFKKYFYEIAGEDMEIDAFQFRKVINMGLRSDPNHRDIGVDACKTMMTLVDVNLRGKLGYFEFLYLWNCILSWQKSFYSSDNNNNGSISAYELRNILTAMGYRLSSSVISRLVFRYADEKYEIDLDSFLICMTKLLALFNVFKTHQNNGRASFSLEEWLEKAVVL